jgi:hypothetical protein
MEREEKSGHGGRHDSRSTFVNRFRDHRVCNEGEHGAACNRFAKDGDQRLERSAGSVKNAWICRPAA